MVKILAFVHVPGCTACEAAKAEWHRFQPTARRLGVECVDIDLTTVEFPDLGINKWSPRATPSWILRVEDKGYVLEGWVSEPVLTKWVSTKLRQVAGGPRWES